MVYRGAIKGVQPRRELPRGFGDWRALRGAGEGGRVGEDGSGVLGRLEVRMEKVDVEGHEGVWVCLSYKG